MNRLVNGFLDYIIGARIKDGPNNIRRVYQNMLVLISIVTIVIVFCFYFYFKAERLFELLTILSVIGAFYIGGSAIGFVFAIPKSAQGRKVAAIPRSKTSDETKTYTGELYNDNTNLEEISDWLTKIIVGISLTQFNHLLDMTDISAKRIAGALKSCSEGCPTNDFYVFSYAVIVFYFISGLIIGYMWARIDFPKILTQNKKDLEIIQELEHQNSTLKEQNSTIVSLMNKPDSVVNLTEIQQESDYIDPNLYRLVMAIANSKPVRDKTDIQKNRWGGKAAADGYELSVSVSSSKIPFLYKVKIVVECISGHPFTSPVAILLHDSFKPMIRLLDAAEKQNVFLEVVAYEAFTVAALTNIQSETSYTSLELDMNEVPQLPSGFYWTDKV